MSPWKNPIPLCFCMSLALQTWLLSPSLIVERSKLFCVKITIAMISTQSRILFFSYILCCWILVVFPIPWYSQTSPSLSSIHTSFYCFVLLQFLLFPEPDQQKTITKTIVKKNAEQHVNVT